MELVFGADRLTPRQYGEEIVVLSGKSAQELVKSLIGYGAQQAVMPDIFTRMQFRPRLAELTFVGLHVAHYFVDAELRFHPPTSALEQIYQGITEKLRTLLPDKEIIEMVEGSMKIFGESLHHELTTPPPDIGLNNPYGPTAELAFSTIKDLYTQHGEFFGKQLNVSPIDELFALTAIQLSGVSIFGAINNSKLAVAPLAVEKTTIISKPVLSIKPSNTLKDPTTSDSKAGYLRDQSSLSIGWKAGINKEHKEGFFIVSISIAVLLLFALLSDWDYGLQRAFFCFNGISVSCETDEETSIFAIFYTTHCISWTRTILAFCVEFKHVLMAFIPIILYGLLRMFGIVRRLFRFEERLFKFID